MVKSPPKCILNLIVFVTNYGNIFATFLMAANLPRGQKCYAMPSFAVRAWMCNHFYIKLSNVLTYPCPTLDDLCHVSSDEEINAVMFTGTNRPM